MLVLSLAFILALVTSAIVLLIGIVIFSEVVEAMEITLPLGITGNQTEGTFFGIAGGQASSLVLPLQVYELDKSLFSTNQTTIISSVTITGLGFTTDGVNGLARDPTDGTFYGVAKDQANSTNRHLISVDPVTGVGVDIGGMGQKFVTLGIKADGTLRTITGLGATTPFQYHSVDKTNGQTTLLCTFSHAFITAGTTVGSIAFNTKDGNMYWLIGFVDPPSLDRMTLLRIDNESTCALTDIGDSDPNGFLPTISSLEVIGLTYSPADDLFYGTSLSGQSDPVVNPTVPPCGVGAQLAVCRITYTITSTGVLSNGNFGSFPSLPVFVDIKSLSFDLAGGGTNFTSTEQSQLDTFENAQAIGFTVIGILPVALFFALFSIFSGRFE